MTDNELLEATRGVTKSLQRLRDYVSVHFPNDFDTLSEEVLLPDIAIRIIEDLKSKNEINGVEISSLLRELRTRDRALATHGVVLNPNVDVPLATDYLDRGKE